MTLEILMKYLMKPNATTTTLAITHKIHIKTEKAQLSITETPES